MSRMQVLCVVCALLVFDECYSQNPNNFRGQTSNFNNGQGNNFHIGNGAQNRGNSGPPGPGNDSRLSAQRLGMFNNQNNRPSGGNPFGKQMPPQSWNNGNNNGPQGMSNPFQPNGPANQPNPNQINIEKLKLHLQNAQQRLQQNSGGNPDPMNQRNGPSRGPNNANANSQRNGQNFGSNDMNANNFKNPSAAAGQNSGNMNPNMKNFRNMQAAFQFRQNQQNSKPNNNANMNQQQNQQQQQQQQPQQQPPQQQQQKQIMPNGTNGRNAAGKKNMNKGRVNKANKMKAGRGNKMRSNNNKPSGMKLTPKKVSPRKFYWKTLFPSGVAAEENAEILYSTKLVLITSEQAPAIDEFNKGGILMDFKRGMMAVRIDVVPGTNFPGMPFNGQRACFLMKNTTTFDQTVKELHTRGKTKRNLELGEIIHMVAAIKNRLTGPEVRRRGGVFITRYCQDAINSDNVFLLQPEAAVEMSPKTFQVSGLTHAMEPLYPIPVNIAVEMTIDFGPPPTMTPAMNFNPSTPGWGKGWGNNAAWG